MDMGIAKKLERNSIPVTECGCQIWLGASLYSGYGRVWTGHKVESTHRVAWEIANGPIPEWADVLHTCDTPSCINSDHLFLGTNGDNIADKIAKERQCRGITHGRVKLTEDQVLEIRKSSGRLVDVANTYGVSKITISRIRNRKRWVHLPDRIKQEN